MKLDELPERYRKQAFAQIQTAPAVPITNAEQVEAGVCGDGEYCGVAE